MNYTIVDVKLSDKFQKQLESLNLCIKKCGSTYYIWDIKQDKEIFEFYYNPIVKLGIEESLINSLNSYFQHINTTLNIQNDFKKSVMYKGYLKLQMIYPFLINN